MTEGTTEGTTEGSADVTVKRLDEFDSAFGGAMKLVRHGLGVESFGLQVLDMPPNADRYPEHDHSHDGQEEVYTVLEGAAKLLVDGEEHDLEPGTFARVGPNQKRKLVTEDRGARLLAIGGTAGKAYEVQAFTQPQEQ
jgi:quercetin dioxygenase-like cupin family protein